MWFKTTKHIYLLTCILFTEVCSLKNTIKDNLNPLRDVTLLKMIFDRIGKQITKEMLSPGLTKLLCCSSLLITEVHTVGRDVPNSYFQSRDEKTRLSVPGYKNSGTKDRQNRSFPFQGQCTQKHAKY